VRLVDGPHPHHALHLIRGEDGRWCALLGEHEAQQLVGNVELAGGESNREGALPWQCELVENLRPCWLEVDAVMRRATPSPRKDAS